MVQYKPRHGFTSDEVYILKLIWKQMQRSGYIIEFASADAFIRWARGKYDYGLTLERIDKHKGWGPDNCRFFNPRKDEKSQEYHRSMVKAWEEMIRPLRKKFAKELANMKTCERQFFRYEHPDLVREGIVFEGTRSV
jgi:hypothetical protein